ncbi:EAL domain-containing protein [Massilia sp. ZL223]|uniref:bifunctional diguanylate cyclase/phosphodiesterase n=1 Tax=Massilia sp. ZL223 TaxID=2824904 RepID=UPI001B81595D|nr:EAL domain-containing protein [Massilia sp. ZL223]MBQ5964738.1 EAL domain-containing protein [Massilia sp. ZL223]
MIDNSLDLLALGDHTGRLLRVNAAARELLGYAPEEMAGRHYTEFVHVDDHAHAAAIEASLREGRPARRDVQLRYVRKDGAVILMSIAVRWSPALQCMFITARDITRQESDRVALRQSKDRLDAMLESIGDAFFAIDAEWRVTYANRKASDFVGIELSSGIGRKLLDVAPELEESEALAFYREAMASREPRTTELYWKPRDIWIEIRAYPNEDGLSVYFHDITAKRDAEGAVRANEQRFRSLFHQAGDSIMLVDRSLSIVAANGQACARFGYTEAEFAGMAVTDLNPDISLPQLGRALRAGRPQLLRTRKTRKDGTSFPAEVHISRFEDGGEALYLAIIRDLSDREEAGRQLRDSERRFREVIEMTPAGYLLAGADGVLRDVNPALCALTGRAREALIGQPLTELFVAFPWQALADGATGAAAVQGMEAVIRHRDGRHLHVLFNGSIERGADGRLSSLTGLMADITGRKLAESRLRELATHDTLTGLPNRALLGERIQDMLDRCSEGDTVAVMFLDLDRFKEVNDSFGHEMGDVLLCEVARRLTGAVRADDLVARLGGDEFVVAAHCTTGTAGAARVADKLLEAMAAPVVVGGHDMVVGASIGISMYPRDARTRETLFQTADTAMYRAKSSGRNRYRFFEPEMTVAAQVRMALEVSLRPALARREFELHYQPRIDLRSMEPVGMEALIRWNHPERGRVPPQQFIAIAEETGLIAAIGHWVLLEACAQTRRLIDEYGRPIRVSVNVSARQLAQPGFGAEVRDVLARTGLPRSCLELELTESALIEDIEHTASMLRELKKLGLVLAVDDFGTGYSSLAYLRRFPIDVLKLDRSFVLQQDDTITAFEFVKAFVGMAHALNMAVVAEGVETAEVLDFLCAAECDEAQGYYLARPAPLDAVRDLLTPNAPRLAG